MVEPSEGLQLVFDKALGDAKKLKHEYVTLEHMVYAMLCVDSFETIVDGYGADVKAMKAGLEAYLKVQIVKILKQLLPNLNQRKLQLLKEF